MYFEVNEWQVTFCRGNIYTLQRSAELGTKTGQDCQPPADVVQLSPLIMSEFLVNQHSPVLFNNFITSLLLSPGQVGGG